MSKTGFEELLESLVAYFRSGSNVSSPPPSRQERHIGTPAEREAAMQIIDMLRSRGYEFYRRPPKKPVRVPSDLRFYSRQGKNLFIYVSEKGDMIDLDLFPEEIELFGPESAWRLNNKAVIVSDAEEGSLDRAEAILEENEFRRWDHAEEVLIHYFALGDFSVFNDERVKNQSQSALW